MAQRAGTLASALARLVLSIDLCFVFLNLVQVALPNVNQFTWELGAKFLRFIARRNTERQLVMVRKAVFVLIYGGLLAACSLLY